MPFFAPAYMRLLYRFLQLPAEKEARLFEGTDVDSHQLMGVNPTASFDQQMAICRNALALCDPGLGLRMGKQLQLAAHGVLGTAMQHAANLDEALDTFVEFVAVRASFLSVRKIKESQKCELQVDVCELDAALIPFFSEAVLSTIDHCVSLFVAAGDAEKSLKLAYPAPNYAHRYQDMLAADVTFDAGSTRYSFPRRYLSLAGLESDPVVYRDAVSRCRDEINRRTDSDSVSGRIDRFLRENPGKLWRLEEIARVLHTSKRTILRRLRAEGTTYQSIRDEVLREQSLLYLRSMPVSAVTAALGFADESSFRRSFRRWFGESPGQYRQNTGEELRV